MNAVIETNKVPHTAKTKLVEIRAKFISAFLLDLL